MKAYRAGNSHLLWYAADSKIRYRKMNKKEWDYLANVSVKQIRKDLKSRKPNMAIEIIESFENRDKETYYR